ncbi:MULTISPECIES: hypothetical protein [Pseudanabaena]|uniref:hypothetical protein n=1 Tax=Pseudanabaena TaxID=1152 RepID=UPI00247AA934|nr:MULTISPECIES: hypothetical protein [Pseudanabaena]MEA5487728.1 hypothetical protein [Pseudanabaena sp. CCNP1317]WGS72533.1 hypothetical protein OA858_00480 [Pseudanabaena galeata CCNP1313]
MDYKNKVLPLNPSIAKPVAINLQTRPFSKSEDQEEDPFHNHNNSIIETQKFSDNLMGKLISMPTTESATPIQRKPENRLKAMRAQKMAIQTKLNIGEPESKYEKEADETAANVVQQINSATNLSLQPQGVRQNTGDVQQLSTINNSQDKTITNRQYANIEKVSSTGEESIQRLALQYGSSPPIPEDAKKLAAHQDNTRVAKIDVQQISGDGSINISGQVYKDMADSEEIFLVAHGRPPLGDQPAMLESGDGSSLNGSNVAGIFNTIRSGLKGENKSLGEFKIEACMSSLSRKTKGGKFGGYFVKEKPSLLDDTKNSLKKTYKVKDLELKGNLGFSAGSELEDGVQNTTPEGTEIGLLDPLTAGIRDAGDNSDKAAPMIADALNIVSKQKNLLNEADKIKNLQLKDLHGHKSTVDFLSKSFAAFKTNNPPDYTLESVLTILVGYIKSQAQ